MSTKSSFIGRKILATAAAAGALALTVALVQMPQAATSSAIPKGPGSASGAPHLSKGFTDTFTSRYVNANVVHLHAVLAARARHCFWSMAGHPARCSASRGRLRPFHDRLVGQFAAVVGNAALGSASTR